MAETLGSLCDKLTIVKLKEWHSEKQPERMRSLATQEQQLREEIDAFIADAASGRIPVERLTFAANKVYRKEGNAVPDVTGGIGAVFSHLAEVNCRLWHEVDKGYEIEKVPQCLTSSGPSALTKLTDNSAQQSSSCNPRPPKTNPCT